MAFRLRIRRIMKNARTHVVAIARKPSTDMTAMAHRGKLELLEPVWMLPLDVGPPKAPERDGEDPVVETVMTAVEAIEATTESAYVV